MEEIQILKILGLITWIATILIILIITVRSIADVAKGMGMLPERIDRWLYAGERRRVREFLDELGVLPRSKYYRSITRLLDSPLEVSFTDEQIRERLRNIVSGHIVNSNFTIGDYSRISINNYINLRGAFCASDSGKQLAVLMSCFIQNKVRELHFDYDCIVSRKGSFDILGYLVAYMLGVPFLLFNDFPAVWEKSASGDETAIRLEYEVPNVRNAIIVDDSCVSGTSIIQMATSLRTRGFEVEHAFVFFIRNEANPIQKLSASGVQLHNIDEFDDASLAILNNRG